MIWIEYREKGVTLLLGPQINKNFGHKIVNIFLSVSLNICFGCLKERSYRDDSLEYPQHMFWLRNKKVNFDYTLLSGGLNKLNKKMTNIIIIMHIYLVIVSIQSTTRTTN